MATIRKHRLKWQVRVRRDGANRANDGSLR
jgi:hypothetical protein